MYVEIGVRNADGETELLLSGPFDDGEPKEGDSLTFVLKDGVALFRVFDRNWVIERSEDGEGYTRKLVIMVTSLGSRELATESAE